MKLELSKQPRSLVWLLQLSEWCQKRKTYGDHAFVGSGIRRDAPLNENERRLMKENAKLRKANEILKDALGFFAKDRKK